MQSENLLQKINGFYRLKKNDSDEQIHQSMQEIIHLWPDVLAAGDRATDDELFVFNVSRTVLFQVFTIAMSKEFFRKDSSLVRDIFFTCFNTMSNYANIFQTSHSIYIESNIRLLLCICSSVTTTVIFEPNDFTNNHEQNLLIAIREYIDQSQNYDDLTEGCVSLVWNLADRTNLVPILLQTGYAESVIKWVEQRKTKFPKQNGQAPIHILHNLLRHDDGIDKFNELNTKAIVGELETDPDLCADDLIIYVTMIRALLSDYEQIKAETDRYPSEHVDTLVGFVFNATEDERYRFENSHLSEPLTVLVKLFANQQILDETFMDTETDSITIQEFIKNLTDVFEKLYSKINVSKDLLDTYTCVAILNLFNYIFEHEIYQTKIENTEQLLTILNKVIHDEFEYVDTFMPRTMKSIKEAAINIHKNFSKED